MNITELAKQAGLGFLIEPHWMCQDELEAFAKLVVANIDPKSFMTWQEGYAVGVAQEREACAKICDDMDSISDYYTLRVELICAQAIRARNNT